MSWLDEVIENVEESPPGDWRRDWFEKWFIDNPLRDIVSSWHDLLERAYAECFGSTDGLYPEHDGWMFHPDGYLPVRVKSISWPEDLDPSVSEEILEHSVGERAHYSAVDDRILHRARVLLIATHAKPAFRSAIKQATKRIDEAVVRRHRLLEAQHRLREEHPFLMIGDPEHMDHPREKQAIVDQHLRLKDDEKLEEKRRKVLVDLKHWLELWQKLYTGWFRKIKKERVTVTPGNWRRLIRPEDVYERNEEFQSYIEGLPVKEREDHLNALGKNGQDAGWVLLGHWYMLMLVKCGAPPEYLRELLILPDSADGNPRHRTWADIVEQIYRDAQEK